MSEHYGDYLPKHAGAAAQVAGNAINYLNSIKPNNAPENPLDEELPVNKVDQAKYDRALDIAQNPMRILQHANDGTLQENDVLAFKAIYPQMYNELTNKMATALINHKAMGDKIPYQKKRSLNLLLNKDGLDSTMTQQSMHNIIGSTMQAQNQTLSTQKPHSHNKVPGSSLAQINKVNSMYQTPYESREFGKRK
jgi:hypothetical protein